MFQFGHRGPLGGTLGQPNPNINREERFLRGTHIEDVLDVKEDVVMVLLKLTLKFCIL